MTDDDHDDAPTDGELRTLVVDVIAEADVAAMTAGAARNELRRRGVEVDRSTVSTLLHDLVSEGVLVYHLGEYGEFAVPDDGG